MFDNNYNAAGRPYNRLYVKPWMFERRDRCLRTRAEITNADIARLVDTNDAWIVARAGIRERRIAREDELTSDQGSRTCRAASGCHGERRGFNIGDHMHAGHAVSFERLSDTA